MHIHSSCLLGKISRVAGAPTPQGRDEKDLSLSLVWCADTPVGVPLQPAIPSNASTSSLSSDVTSLSTTSAAKQSASRASFSSLTRRASADPQPEQASLPSAYCFIGKGSCAVSPRLQILWSQVSRESPCYQALTLDAEDFFLRTSENAGQ